MKSMRLLSFVLLSSVIVCLLSGCISRLFLNEDVLYRESINNFFTALDKGDKEGIKKLFSNTVISEDEDLDEQIEKLISMYPRSTTEVHFDGLVGGEYENHYGVYKSTAYDTFPVVCDGEYYWVYMELVYEDDSEPDNIGLRSVMFYTAYEYCMFFNDDNSTMPEESGLLVYTQTNPDVNVRCINSFPREFVSYEREIKLSDVESFLAENKNINDFIERFGEANATGMWTWYWLVVDDEGKEVYVELGVPDIDLKAKGVIEWATVYDEFEYIKSIVKSKSDSDSSGESMVSLSYSIQ